MKKPNKEVAVSTELNWQSLCRRHLIFGWWSLFLFVTLGILLEALHGFKLGAYLGADAETRRFMWTLAHAHGTLLGLVHIAFANTVATLEKTMPRTMNWASLQLIGAGVLMPAGFFLGGVFYYSGDPGLGIFLVPPGGILLMVAVLTTAMAVSRKG
jgi:hypothetical protein